MSNIKLIIQPTIKYRATSSIDFSVFNFHRSTLLKAYDRHKLLHRAAMLWRSMLLPLALSDLKSVMLTGRSSSSGEILAAFGPLSYAANLA